MVPLQGIASLAAIVLGVLVQISLRYAVLDDLDWRQSLGRGIGFVRANFAHVALTYLLAAAIAAGVALVASIAARRGRRRCHDRGRCSSQPQRRARSVRPRSWSPRWGPRPDSRRECCSTRASSRGPRRSGPSCSDASLPPSNGVPPGPSVASDGGRIPGTHARNVLAGGTAAGTQEGAPWALGSTAPDRKARDMRFGEIIKKAWHITWHYRWLWVLGVFAGITGGSSGGGGGSGGGNTSSFTPVASAPGAGPAVRRRHAGLERASADAPALAPVHPRRHRSCWS